jgi:6-pyruvoyltetrahydropterin/6-carboxytetrahydropterin synthase
VTIEGNELNSEGMIVDYSKIKNVIKEFDHQNLNKLMSPDGETQVINPTAENLAKNIYFKLKSALYLDEYKVQVEVSETENNFATFGDLD